MRLTDMRNELCRLLLLPIVVARHRVVNEHLLEVDFLRLLLLSVLPLSHFRRVRGLLGGLHAFLGATVSSERIL